MIWIWSCSTPLDLLLLHCHSLFLAPLLLHILSLVSSTRCSALLSFFLHYVVSCLWTAEF